eukprot:760443-Hanusia_phi.AAC.5
MRGARESSSLHHVGDLELDGLQLRDGAAERHTRLRVPASMSPAPSHLPALTSQRHPAMLVRSPLPADGQRLQPRSIVTWLAMPILPPSRVIMAILKPMPASSHACC